MSHTAGILPLLLHLRAQILVVQGFVISVAWAHLDQVVNILLRPGKVAQCAPNSLCRHGTALQPQSQKFMEAVKRAVCHVESPKTLIHPLHISRRHKKQVLVILIVQRRCAGHCHELADEFPFRKQVPAEKCHLFKGICIYTRKCYAPQIGRV